MFNINCFKCFFSPQIGKNCVLYLFIYTSTFIYKNIYSSSSILHVICTQHANTVFRMPKDTYRINLLHNSFVRVPGQLFSSKDRPTIILTKTVTNQICFSECKNLGKGKLFSKWLNKEGKEAPGSTHCFLWRIKLKRSFLFSSTPFHLLNALQRE